MSSPQSQVASPGTAGNAATPGPSNAAARKARTRKALLEAAGTLFATQGVERTTVEEIAEAAGLSVGSIYKHFANKEALAVAFVDESLAVAEEYLAEAHRLPAPNDRVTGAGEAYIRFAREHAAACRFNAMRSFDPTPGAATDPIDQAMSRRMQTMLLTVAADLKEAMDLGLVRRMPIDEAMVFLWGAWSGVAHLLIRQDAMAIPGELGDRALALGVGILKDAIDLVPAAAPTAEPEPEPV